MQLPKHSFLPCALAVSLMTAALQAQKLKVYILAGQSNMQGHARVETIDYIAEDPATKELHARLVDRKGEPRVAKDNGNPGRRDGCRNDARGYARKSDRLPSRAEILRPPGREQQGPLGAR